jgi:hypothetical protein
VVYETAWAVKGYWLILAGLGVLAVICGVYVLKQTAFKLWAVIGVALGLLVGQWWFLFSAMTLLLWRWRGFAP